MSTPETRAGLFINRELSWLAFNERVMAQAADPTVPLFERLKFAAITASNLDEFFMVRVAGLKHAIADGDGSADPSGLTAGLQLAGVTERSQALMRDLYDLVTRDLIPALALEGIQILSFADLDSARRPSLGAFFKDSVHPVLTPLAIDASRPFPLLSSLTLNLVLLLEPAQEETEPRLAVVQVPAGIGRLVQLSDASGVSVVLLEDIIRAHVSQLFPGQTIREIAVVRLTRDAELELDVEGGRTYLDRIEREVRRRRRSDVVRLEIEATASDELVDMLRRQLDLRAEDVYAIHGPLDLRVLMNLIDLPGFEELRDQALHPADVLASEQGDLFSVLDERDVLLHHPYDAYDPVLALVAQAAEDPDVLAIKQTLYRTSPGSPLIGSLQRAAERGKQVAVIVEVTARFDEERNIQWARALEEAGAHVIYGVRGYKIHAKVCLIVRRTPQGFRRYVHLGTGNYNERTARVYTDIGLMTSSPVIAEDAAALFNTLTGYSDPPGMKKLVMAPTGLRRRLLRLIARERRRADAGQPAEIVAKMNSLSDEEIVEALYDASRAGVQIRLNVRGICVLRPGLAPASANIEVISIVDRFLEHARIFYFLNGGDDEVYISSADWMTRNLDTRIELMYPVEAPEHKTRVVTALRAMFRDNVQAWDLGPDGVYRRRRPATGDAPFRVQQHLQEEARRRVASRTYISIQPLS